MSALSKIPNVGDESLVTRQAQSAFFRLLLSYIDRKIHSHLEYFSGSDNIPSHGPVIIVPNHQSYFDGFVLTSLFWKLTNRMVRIPTNIKALTNPLTTFCQVAGGAVPINPSDKSDTYARISALLEQGEAVVIYPEGTRSDGTFLHPFKFGAFNLAVATGVPILPVAVRNFAGILPRGSLKFQPGQTGSIVFGELIDPASPRFAGDDKKAVAARICTEVRDWMEKTVFTPPSPADVQRAITKEVTAVACRADTELEALLDQNAELITRKDADRILNITGTSRILGATNFELDLQELRAVGFRVGDMPFYRAVFSLGQYKALLDAALAQDSAHAYLNYCIGLLQLKLPRLIGGGDIDTAVQCFKTAYVNAARDGYPQTRFVHGYALALARQGRKNEALSLLKATFDGARQASGLRELRRRERGMALMSKLAHADETTPTPPNRPLRGFELVMAQTRISDLIIGQVDGIVDFSQVIDAAGALQKRHPGLRARVVWPEGRDKRPVFEYQPADEMRLHVREVRSENWESTDDRPLWEQVAEAEVNHLFDLSEGYMFRVTWLPESGHIILNAQHSVVDGVSLMRLLHEFTAHCAGKDIGGELPPTASALESGPKVNIMEKVVGWFHREIFIRARVKFHEWSTLPLNGKLAKNAQIKTETYFADGDPDRFDEIRRACRAHGVTVGSTYAAAIQCAMLHFSRSSYGPKEKYYVPMDFSLRRYIPNGDTAQEAVGLFSGSAPVIFDGDPTMTFWEMAKKFGEKSQAEIDMKSPLIFHQVFDKFHNLEKAYEKYGLHCVNAGGAGGPLTMSNVGKFPYDAKIGEVRLNAVHGMSASQRGGAMLYFWLRSVQGRFFYSGTAINPATTRERGQGFFDLVVFLMENCLTPDAGNKAIRDYIPDAVARYDAAKKAPASAVRHPEAVA